MSTSIQHGRQRSRCYLAFGMVAVASATIPASMAPVLDDCSVFVQSGTKTVQFRSDVENSFPFDFLNFRKPTQVAEPDPGQPYRQAMINFGDAQYITYFKIGKQLLAGIPDTGSFELIVFGANCRTCGVAAHYNPYLSTTYTPGLLMSQQSYGTGSCSSTEAYDFVSIGPYPMSNQTFWTVEQAQMPMLNNAAFEAIIGIGPPETPAADAWNAAASVIENVSAYFDEGHQAPIQMREQVASRIKIANEMSVHPPILNTFGVKTFSICMGIEPKSDGYIIWNDDAHTKTPELFVKVPVTGQHTWSGKLTNAQLALPTTGDDWGGYLGCAEGCAAILDSGTSLLTVPDFVMENLRKVMESRNWTCNTISELPALVFQLGEVQFSLPPDAYVAQVEGEVPDHVQTLLKLDQPNATVIDVGANATEAAAGESSDVNTDATADMPPQEVFSSADAASDEGENGPSEATDGASEPKCQLLVMESRASTRDGPLWILGVPFFRQYYTTFSLGESLDDRELYFAPAGKDCTPSEATVAMESSFRSIDMSRVYLPESAQRAATQNFLDI